MFKNIRIILFILAVLLLNANFLLARPAVAEEVSNSHVVLRDTKASNPKCQMSQMIGIIAGVSAALTTLVTGVTLKLAVITIKVGIALLIIGIGSIVGLVMSTPMFFACNFSFVRHPVLRSDINDGSDGQSGSYRQCKNPKPNYPSCANGVFQNQDEYFKCIGGGDIEKGRKNEPRCLDKEFEKVSEYYWPKNRVSSSDYIEVCYRLPLGFGLSPVVLVVTIPDTEIGGPDGFFTKNNESVHGGTGMTSHDPREADYGGEVIKRMKAYIRGPIECSGPLRAGEKAKIYGITFKAVERGDKLCVDTWGMGDLVMWPQQEVGCHMRPSGPPAPMCEKSVAKMDESGKIVSYNNDQCFNWYISPACYSKTGAHTKSPFPLTSVVVECIRESLDNLLTGRDSDGNKKEDGFLGVAQKRLKTAIKAALILALMLFAIKAALGGVQHTAEVYMLVIKFALVLYFTIGPGMSDYYGKLIQLSTGLSDIVLKAGGNQTVCNYDQSEYLFTDKKGKQHNLGYLAPWDRLDCRIMFYLGSQLNATTGATMFATLLAAAFIPFAILFGAQILICIAALFMVVMIILVAIWIVYLFILSLIALTIIILISPLFIPMSLFQATKGFFDGWLREIMTYSLYPVILFAFLSLMFSVFDNLYFGDLKFKRVDYGGGLGTITKTAFTLDPDNACDLAGNRDNLACIMNTMGLKNHTILFGIEITGFEFDGGLTGSIWTKLGMMALMGFLFYHFLGTIGSLAAELAGNPRANLSAGVTSPTAMMKKGLSAAMSAHSGASNAVKSVGRKIAGGKGGSGGKKAGEEITKG